jgi:hypothetical protein
MPIFLSFNDTESEPFKICDDFIKESEFLRNMLQDCDSSGNDDQVIVPFPFEISNQQNFSRFYKFWETNKFENKDNIVVDVIDFINLADFLQMNDFKDELFVHLKNKLRKQSLDELNVLLNPFGTDVQPIKEKYDNVKEHVSILKNFYDNEKSSLSFSRVDE